jgi:hypothetical protein
MNAQELIDTAQRLVARCNRAARGGEYNAATKGT